MDLHERSLSNSPSLQSSTGARTVPRRLEEGGEKTPLLESVKDVEGTGKDSETGPGVLKKKWDFRSLVLLAVLWLVILFIGAAYSLISPFFPEEVSIWPLCSLFIRTNNSLFLNIYSW